MESNLNFQHSTDEAATPHTSSQEMATVVDLDEVRSLSPSIPSYLRDVYNWTYLNPRNVRFLDNEFVVSFILWGQHRRLQKATFKEFSPGQRVLQPASVYGDFSAALARHLGEEGALVVSDIAPIQVATTRRKLKGLQQATAHLADARAPIGAPYDAVCCYFLLHELPDDYKREVVDALLNSVGPDGKVVFVDYHKPYWTHPLKAVMSVVYDTLEPFAKSLWHTEIRDYATDSSGFTWSKETRFGGLYQQVVAERLR